jgi:hypothetical protein
MSEHNESNDSQADELDQQQQAMGSAAQEDAMDARPTIDEDDQQIAMGSAAQGLITGEDDPS